MKSLKSDLKDLRIGVFETRLQDEIVHGIEKRGGHPLLAPSVKEVPLSNHKEAFQAGSELKAGRLDILILQTGTGTSLLLKILETQFPKNELIRLLKKITLLARGPKPAEALAEYGLKPLLTTAEPATWREILKTLDAHREINGLAVAVQEAREPNRLLLGELKARGARVLSVPVYRTTLPDDIGPLKNLIEETIFGSIDMLIFTNSSQADHVMAVARQEGKAQEFRRAALKTVVASIGPVCSLSLQNNGLPIDFEPTQPSLKALLVELSEKGSELLERKKSGPVIQLPPNGAVRLDDHLYNSLFMKACRREPTSRTPVWLMRQAGRYMKEYRELRAKVPFKELCKNSDLAAEVTVEAAHRLGVDAAIIFSDLLLLSEPMGFTLEYSPDPRIADPFRSEADLARLKVVQVEDSMEYVFEAIRKTRGALKADLPLIGFAGAPFTMAAYLIEGKTSRNFIETKKLMTEAPAVWDAFLEKITRASIDYLNAQVAAGAQAVQIFDSWVGCLSPEDFRKHVLPHTRRLVKGVMPGVPVITFGTQTTGFLPIFREAGGDVVGVDWRVELDEAWDQLGDVAIQGNLDPVVLLSNPREIKAQTQRILNQAAGRPGHIFNLGHGVLPETPIENVLTLVETVKELSLSKGVRS